MKERFENDKVHAGVLEQADLLGDVVARLVERTHSFAFDQLCARDAARHERSVAGDFLRELHGGMVDLLGLRAVAGPVKLFARAEECERLQHLRAGVEKLAVKLPQRVGVLDGHLRRELAATLAGADLFATGPAVHATAAFEFDEITAVAQDNSFFEESSDGFHGLCRVEPLVW